MQSIHDQIKYPCDSCDYQATIQRNLRRHKKSVHMKIIAGENSPIEHRGSVPEQMKHPCGIVDSQSYGVMDCCICCIFEKKKLVLILSYLDSS